MLPNPLGSTLPKKSRGKGAAATGATDLSHRKIFSCKLLHQPVHYVHQHDHDRIINIHGNDRSTSNYQAKHPCSPHTIPHHPSLAILVDLSRPAGTCGHIHDCVGNHLELLERTRRVMRVVRLCSANKMTMESCATRKRPRRKREQELQSKGNPLHCLSSSLFELGSILGRVTLLALLQIQVGSCLLSKETRKQSRRNVAIRKHSSCLVRQRAAFAMKTWLDTARIRPSDPLLFSSLST